MKNLTRFALLSTAALTLCALPASGQDVDPYALYDAVKSGEVVLEPPKPQEGIEPPVISQTQPEPGTAVIEPGTAIIDMTGFDSRISETSGRAPEAEDADAQSAGPDEAPQAINETVPEIDAPKIIEPDAEISAAGDMLLSIDDPDKNAINAAKLTRADIAPYFLSAAEYKKLRGTQSRPQTTLIYEVTQSNLAGKAQDIAGAPAATTTEVMLAIGDDYVARQSSLPGDALRIYDFKYNRVLTITPAADNALPAMFSNAPLYALAHRNIRTVGTMTKNGKADKIDLAPDVSLDAFWIESAKSWAMTERADDVVLTSETDGAVLTYAVLTYKDAPVFSVDLSDEAYAEPEHADALLAFAHLDMPIHPAGLKQLYGAAPIKTMSITSKSPQSPKGQKQVWTLKSISADNAPFPLPAGPVNTLTSTQTDPIAFVMNLAARGTAPGGPPAYDDLADAVLTAMDADDYEAAWLAAKRYEQFSRPCQKNNIRKACKALREIEDMRKKPESLNILLEAYEDAEAPKTRVKALQALRPWLGRDDIPADIMRLAGVARAKIDAATAKAAGLDDIKAEDLIKGAMIKEPYSAQTYLAMAQYYAAIGDYNASWNVFDALRSAIETDRKTKFAVDKVERSLQKRAPGYFLPAAMAER